MIAVDKGKCVSCGGCVSVCPVFALVMNDRYPQCSDKCNNCKICVRFCPVGALEIKK